MSIERGLANASVTAFFVISLNVTRLVVSGFSFASSATCHAMASPSRSGSGASQTVSASLAALRIAVMAFFAVARDSGSYAIFTPPLTSIPKSDFGRSRTCPIEASTL
jgi:hypothetical protein